MTADVERKDRKCSDLLEFFSNQVMRHGFLSVCETGAEQLNRFDLPPQKTSAEALRDLHEAVARQFASDFGKSTEEASRVGKRTAKSFSKITEYYRSPIRRAQGH